MRHFIMMVSACLLFQTMKAGVVDTISVSSTIMKKKVSCVIITPESYKNGDKKYPVLFLLHGYSGNYRQWIGIAPQLKAKVDELQMIIVCPDGGFNSWYLDSPIDSTVRYETFVSGELTTYIDKNYRTIADRKHRAISGLSMGGHGGLYLGIRHLDIYGAAGAISGGVDIRPFPNNWDMKKILGDSICCKENWEKNTVINIATKLKNNDLALIIDCGTQDFFIQVNRNLHQKLLEMKIDHAYIERAGAHTNAYWNNSIDFQLLFFKKFFDRI